MRILKNHHVLKLLKWFNKKSMHNLLITRSYTTTNPLYEPKVVYLNAELQKKQILEDNKVINPWFITGFTDGEGCFSISVIKDNRYKEGWLVCPFFEIGLHQKDLALLEQIESFFGVGNITTKQRKNMLQYHVSSRNDLKVILNHFDKYPLITQKQADYILFKQAFNLFINKEHLTMDGLSKIVSIKNFMNLGLPYELKVAFPNIVPVVRPVIKDKNIRDPHWLAGFTTAEGCFYINLAKLGKAIKLCFKLTQHYRDEQLMRSLVEYLGCGNVYIDKEVVEFKITKFDDLYDKVIPFFSKQKLLGVKLQDFKDWCEVAKLMKNKANLTKEGLEQISKIKAGMNRGRK